MARAASDLFFQTSGVKKFDFHWSVEGMCQDRAVWAVV
jgi:hypothetical protein